MGGWSSWIFYLGFEGEPELYSEGLWMLVRHMLSSIYGDIVLSSDRASLIAGIMKGYYFNVAKWIATEIHDWTMSHDTVLEFPCLLTWICLDEGVPEIPGADCLSEHRVL